MKLNELVCPTCGLKCMTDAAYATCASCQTTFYASQSRSVDNPLPVRQPTIYPSWPYTPTWPYTPYTQPQIEIKPIWVVPYGPPGTPHGPTVVCGSGGTVSSTGEVLQAWN